MNTIVPAQPLDYKPKHKYPILQQKAVANCVWMLVKIEGIEIHFAKETTCLLFSMSDFPQFIITFICRVKQMK